MNRMSGRKTRRRRAVKPPPRRATTPAPRTSDQKKIALLTRKLDEAVAQQTATSRELSASLERETATSEVLGIISSSPTDLKPVFETILANATRLCGASYGTLWLCEGDAIRAVAVHGRLPGAFTAWLRRTTESRLLKAMIAGETDAEKLAALGHERLGCTRAALVEVLTGCVR